LGLPVLPALRSLEERIEASLGYMARPCLQKQNKTKQKRENRLRRLTGKRKLPRVMLIFYNIVNCPAQV
jgi:hypothetical protein